MALRRGLLGSGTALLLCHPDQLKVLHDTPALWPNVLEEILRIDSPVQFTGRHALLDTEVEGIPVSRGADVLVALVAAARAILRFSPTRTGSTSAGPTPAIISGSPAGCTSVGARLQGGVGLRKLFERFPDLAAAGRPQRQPPTRAPLSRSWKFSCADGGLCWLASTNPDHSSTYDPNDRAARAWNLKQTLCAANTRSGKWRPRSRACAAGTGPARRRRTHRRPAARGGS